MNALFLGLFYGPFLKFQLVSAYSVGVITKLMSL